MLPVFSGFLSIAWMVGTLLPGQQLGHSLCTACAFIPVVAYNRARVQKSTDAKLIQGDRNNIIRGFKIHSQTRKLQYGSLNYLKIAFKFVLSPCTSYISCDKKTAAVFDKKQLFSI